MIMVLYLRSLLLFLTYFEAFCLGYIYVFNRLSHDIPSGRFCTWTPYFYSAYCIYIFILDTLA